MICVPPPRYALPELALNVPLRWPSKPVLRVRWMGGSAELHRRIVALEAGPDGWASACGVRWLFGTGGDAEVRVKFAPGGSWAHVGNYPLPQDMPTCNLALTDDASDGDVRRVWLHEIGHVLGFEHEQLSPNAQIPWDREAVYHAYAERAGWTREQVDAQLFAVLAASTTAAGPYDTASIMHYWVSADWVLDRVERGGADRLSAGDRAMAAQWYGPPERIPEEPERPYTVLLPIVESG